MKRVTREIICYVTTYNMASAILSRHDVWRLDLLDPKGRSLYNDTVEVPTGGPPPPIEAFLERARKNAVNSLIAIEAGVGR